MRTKPEMRNITNVNRSFPRSSFTLNAFLSVESILHHLYFTTCGFDFFFRSFAAFDIL